MLDIVNNIQSNMNRLLVSCGVFIDLKIAFDTVDQDVLLDKLNYYGFRGIINSWFSSYLKKTHPNNANRIIIYQIKPTQANASISARTRKKKKFDPYGCGLFTNNCSSFTYNLCAFLNPSVSEGFPIDE